MALLKLQSAASPKSAVPVEAMVARNLRHLRFDQSEAFDDVADLRLEVLDAEKPRAVGKMLA